MVEYKINIWGNSFRYEPSTNEILIASVDISILSDREISEYVADSLTHEYVHKVLYDMFGFTTTKLFDSIQQYFRNTSIQEKVFGIKEHTGKECYHKFIEREGFKAFLEYYHIDEHDIIQANIACKRRNINE